MRRVTLILLATISLFASAGGAQAAGGNYVFDGGSPKARSTVRAALNASSFDWNVVSARVTIHLTPIARSQAVKGEIWLDPKLVDAGVFSWGFIQHEYAHQVDFFRFNDEQHASWLDRLGGVSWWQSGRAPHSRLGSERFASTLAWAFWPSKQNALRPHSTSDESAAMAPERFRQLLAKQLDAPQLMRAPARR
jgi:hypothetical protein